MCIHYMYIWNLAGKTIFAHECTCLKVQSFRHVALLHRFYVCIYDNEIYMCSENHTKQPTIQTTK